MMIRGDEFWKVIKCEDGIVEYSSFKQIFLKFIDLCVMGLTLSGT